MSIEFVIEVKTILRCEGCHERQEHHAPSDAFHGNGTTDEQIAQTVRRRVGSSTARLEAGDGGWFFKSDVRKHFCPSCVRVIKAGMTPKEGS